MSAGADARGRTGAATAQAQALHRFGGGGPADRFTRVIGMLDGLVRDGGISSHVEVAPPPSQAARRGTLAVWAFPEVSVVTARGTERWHMLSFRHRPPAYADVRRTAMVRSIVIGASVVHWIETEPRGSDESHRSLVFSQGATLHLTATVTRLLDVAAGEQGVWPEPSVLPGHLPEGGIGRATLWRHRKRKAAATDAADSGQAAAASHFSGAGALAAIREVASG